MLFAFADFVQRRLRCRCPVVYQRAHIAEKKVNNSVLMCRAVDMARP
jgi:hypothetical protein